jgi:uncharacterized Zn finger protein
MFRISQYIFLVHSTGVVKNVSSVPTIRSVWLEGLRPSEVVETSTHEEQRGGLNIQMANVPAIRSVWWEGLKPSEVVETSTHKEQRGGLNIQKANIQTANVHSIRSVWLEGLRPLRGLKPRYYTKHKKDDAKHSKGYHLNYTWLESLTYLKFIQYGIWVWNHWAHKEQITHSVRYVGLKPLST